MDKFFSDVRFALVSMSRAPLTFTLAIISLAVGVAVNTTMFTAIDFALLRPLPYDGAERIVRVWATNPSEGGARTSVSAMEYHDWRERSRAVDLAAFIGGSMNVTFGDVPERLQGVRVTSNFFRVFGSTPLIGRTFTEADGSEDHAGVVMISNALWHRWFGGARDVVGSTLLLNGQPHTIIGVLRRDFQFPSRSIEIFTPLPPSTAADHETRLLSVVGRLHPGVTAETAAVELDDLAAAVGAEHGRTGQSVRALLVPLDRVIFNSAFRTGAWICMAAVAFVLLIACSNIANLLLARATSREAEITVRAVLGAGRWRIVRQLLTESLVLALIGGALGALLSVLGLKGLIRIVPSDLLMVDRIEFSTRALWFTLVVSAGAGLLFGLVPAIHANRPDFGTVLRNAATRGAVGGGRAGRMRQAIVVAEVGLALALLMCAGLLIKGYVHATGTDLGFDTGNLATMRLTLPETVYRDTAQILAFQSQVEDRLAAVPGVSNVALADALPVGEGGASTSYTRKDRPTPASSQQLVAELRSVTPPYFDAMRIALTAGRAFTDQDRRATMPVAIINESLAAKHWPGANALGDHIELDGRTWQIVGVVGDVHVWGRSEPPPDVIYAPFAQRPVRSIAIVVRSPLPLEGLLPPLREAVRKADANVPLFDVATMDELIRNSQARDRLMVDLLSIFAAIALVLAVLGIHGVMAYEVSLRTPEVGVRMAIGAETADIVKLIMRRGAVLAGSGVALGIMIALVLSRFLAAFLNGVSPFDLPTFTGISTILLAVALGSSYFPAMHAAKLDPLKALHGE